MTGVNRFTRLAGLAGLVAVELAVIRFVLRRTEVADAWALGRAGDVLGLVFVAGVFVRHRGEAWFRPMLGFAGIAAGAWLGASRVAEAYRETRLRPYFPGAGSSPAVSRTTFLAVLMLALLTIVAFVAVLAFQIAESGRLPRRPATWVAYGALGIGAASLIATVARGSDAAGAVFLVLFLNGVLVLYAGITWLAWALWRERPDPRPTSQTDSRIGIAVRGTIPDASGST